MVVIAAVGVPYVGQTVNKRSEQITHLVLRLHQALFGLGLLEDHLLQALLHLLQAWQRQRWLGGCLQRAQLPLQPLVVQTQHGHVLQDQPQQAQQTLVQLHLVGHRKRQAVAKVLQQQECGAQLGLGLAQKMHQLLGHFAQARIAVCKGRLCKLTQACQLVGQAGRDHDGINRPSGFVVSRLVVFGSRWLLP